MTVRARLVLATPLTGLALVGVAGPAVAAWVLPAGSGTATATATSLSAPTGVSAAAVAPTSSAIDIAFTPASNPTGTTYTVTRSTQKNGSAGSQVVCSGLTASPCHDTGLTAGLTFSYTASAVLGSWSASASPVSATTASVATQLTLSASPTTITAGGTTSVTVTARRADNSVDTNFSGTLTWSGSAWATSPSGSTPTATVTSAFSNGVATYSVSLKTAGSGLSLTATGNGVSGSTTMTVTAGAPAALAFVATDSTARSCASGSVVVGNGGSLITRVALVDTLGNVAVAPSSATTVNLSRSPSSGGGHAPSPSTLTIASSASPGVTSSSSTFALPNGSPADTTYTASATSYTSTTCVIKKN